MKLFCDNPRCRRHVMVDDGVSFMKESDMPPAPASSIDVAPSSFVTATSTVIERKQFGANTDAVWFCTECALLTDFIRSFVNRSNDNVITRARARMKGMAKYFRKEGMKGDVASMEKAQGVDESILVLNDASSNTGVYDWLESY